MTTRSAVNTVAAVLSEYGALARAEVARLLDSGQSRGALDSIIADYPSRGGKMMRPSLCLAAARIFGAPLEAAVGTAAAIELLHNGMLVHDDIEDDSELRRGTPTLHALHGVPIAINAGDSLLLLSLRPLIENVRTIGPRLAFTVLVETERMGWEASEGQAMELRWRAQNDFNLKDRDYLTMVLKKTSWLGMIYPMRVGALIATGGRIDGDIFTRFGFFLGSAFQIQDDLLNLTAEGNYGKEALGDILEGKRTLMLLHAYRGASAAEKHELRTLLARPRGERSAERVLWVRALMEKYGSVAYARMVAIAMAGAAANEFDRIFSDLPETRDKVFIRDLITWAIARQ